MLILEVPTGLSRIHLVELFKYSLCFVDLKIVYAVLCCKFLIVSSLH